MVDMAEEISQEQVLEAARALGRDEFTREDIAEKLGTEVSVMRPSWKATKESGRIKQVSNEGGKRRFRLAD
jgi:hypothetical protein